MATSIQIRTALDGILEDLVTSVSGEKTVKPPSAKTTVTSTTKPHIPPLYSTDKAGRIRIWTVTVSGNTVTKVYGLVDGEKITDKRSYEGKNIGRSNETTAKQQALLEAERDWKKQIQKGYTESSSPAAKPTITATTKTATSKTAAVSANGTAPSIERLIIPMKCVVWDSDEKKTAKYFDFAKGVYVQPKYDGVRCTATVQSDGSIVLLSNTSKQFVWLKSLREQIKAFLGDSGVTLDGELYAHDIIDKNGDELDHIRRFGIISGACRPNRSDPSKYEEQINYHVFDVVDTTKPQTERMKILDGLFGSSRASKSPRVIRAPTTKVTSMAEIMPIHDSYADDEYEGVIVRAHDLMYQLKHRSQKMRKLKVFTDAEYEVVGTKLNTGVGEENFVWVCVSSEGIKFSVTPEGSHDMKRKWYKNRKQYIGKLLTVKYKTLGPNNLPVHGTGKGFRHSADLEGGYDSE